MQENQLQFTPVASLTEDQKAVFYRKTYTHLAIAVLMFIVVEYIFIHTAFIRNLALKLTDGFLWLIMLGGFMLATNYAERLALSTTNKNKQYLALGIYVVAEAFIFIPLIIIALISAKESGTNLLSQAAVLTLALFAGISSVAFLSKRDFSFLRSVITITSFVAFGLIIAGMIFGFNLGLWFSAGMVVLASISILYQTSQMIHKYYEEQYVAAALGLFSSIMLLFWYILRIMSRR